MDPITLVLLAAAGGYFLWDRQNKAKAPSLPAPYKAPRPVARGPSPSGPKPVPVRPAPGQTAPKIKDRQRLDAAAVLAVLVAKDITAKGKTYNRKLLAHFQKVANIPVDGKYGPETAGAVDWYVRGKMKAPPPVFGKGYKNYHPGF